MNSYFCVDNIATLTQNYKQRMQTQNDEKQTIGNVAKHLFFYDTALNKTDDTFASPKKRRKRNRNISQSIESKITDIYNELLLTPAKNSSKQPLRVSSDKCKQFNKSQTAPSPPNLRLVRAKSQLCVLLGEEDLVKVTRTKKKTKKTGRIFQMKTEVNQMLNKKYMNKNSSLIAINNLLLTSTNAFLTKAKMKRERKKQIKDDCSYANEISGGCIRKHRNNSSNTKYNHSRDNNNIAMNESLILRLQLKVLKI